MFNIALHTAGALWPDRPTLVVLFAITTCSLGLERFVRLEPAQRNDIIRLVKAIRRRR
ncbi:hypothetical protein [Aeromicrobium chenweiae]|uniref:hypothetical protein n=1 Tax=Aeromicrobium chenweiae TaxID=2079793 RepID=UPI00131EF191|nr:hypothetical protein [Aeromicrobium chenweiae]